MSLLLRLSFVLTLFFSCAQEELPLHDKAKVHTTDDSTPNLMLSISIPQNSGLAFVNYENFTVHSDTLFVIDRLFGIGLDTISNDNYISDTTAIYPLDKSKKIELQNLLESIDSLGHHTAYGCLIQMGRTRFFISAKIDKKEMSGFIANCYREHIFHLIDYLNDCYPKGNVITYSIEELKKTEKECEERDFGRKQDD